MKHIAAIVPVMLVGVIGLACGSSDSGGGVTPPASDAGPTTEPTEGGVVGESLTIGVEDFVDGAARNKPFVGAKLVFHKPGGGDVVGVTDANGIFTATGIDWSKGRGAVTLYAENHLLTTFVELDKTTIPTTNFTTASKTAFTATKPDLVLFAAPNPTTPALKLTGHIQNPQGVNVSMSTSRGNSFWQQKSNLLYSLPVLTNQPCKLYVLDWSNGAASSSPRNVEQNLFNWYELDQPAITENTTRDIDLATSTPATPTKVKGKITIPGGDAGPFGAASRGYITVNLAESMASFIGVVSKVEVNSDGTAFDYDLEYLQPAGEKPFTQFYVIRGDDSSIYSSFIESSFPPDGYVADKAIAPPIVTTSATSTLTSAITATNLPVDAEMRISLFDNAGVQRALLIAPPNVASIKPPKLTGDAATARGPIATLRPFYVSNLDEALDYFFRNSSGAEVDVK